MSVWVQCDDTVNVQGLVDEEIAVQRREDDECGSDHEEEDGGVDDGTLTEVTIEDIATGRALFGVRIFVNATNVTGCQAHMYRKSK